MIGIATGRTDMTIGTAKRATILEAIDTANTTLIVRTPVTIEVAFH